MSEEIKNIHTYDQPIELNLKIGIEIDSKGQKKPSVEIKLTHRLTIDEAKDGRLSKLLDIALTNSLSKCKDTIKKAMED